MLSFSAITPNWYFKPPMPTPEKVHTRTWQPSRIRSLASRFGYPVFFLLNRPIFSWFGKFAYDFALRCNGIAVTFPGRYGLTRGEERFLARHASQLQDGILLDVGANGGSYARHLAYLAPTARIFAFEPHPITFTALSTNLAGIPSIKVIAKAVGEMPGQMTLYDFADNDGSTQASLDHEAVALFTNEVVAHQVECTTIDTFAAGTGLTSVDLLKIDTEGHDLAVLKGASYLIGARKIKMIQFEFIPANIATGVRMRDFFAILAGYDLSRLCINGDLLPLGNYDVKRHEIYVTHNIIAVLRAAP
jgi:FkbM family methyltransferase